MQGIYRIRNKINNKSYIGQSNDIHRRWREHFGNSTTSISPAIRGAIKKYGLPSFELSVLEEVADHRNLNAREEFWIRELRSFGDGGYNLTPGGDNFAIGENNGNAKLNEQDVIAIRVAYKNRERSTEVYKWYSDKIAKSSFEGVWQGKTWPHIMPEVYTQEALDYYSRKATNGGNSTKALLTDLEVLTIRKRYVNETAKSIFEDYKGIVAFQTLQQILWGRAYSDVPIYSKKTKTWNKSPE